MLEPSKIKVFLDALYLIETEELENQYYYPFNECNKEIREKLLEYAGSSQELDRLLCRTLPSVLFSRIKYKF